MLLLMHLDVNLSCWHLCRCAPGCRAQGVK